MESKLDLKSLLNRNVSLPGGKDKDGRALLLVTIPVDAPPMDIVDTLHYLLSIFR